jgi:CelD/BcsL family acetyltransferase involved in cellulose biosynthesis
MFLARRSCSGVGRHAIEDAGRFVTDESLSPALALPTVHGAAAPPRSRLPLGAVDRAAWEALAAVRLEGNGLFEPGFALPAGELAGGNSALLAYRPNPRLLLGLLPVISAWRALQLPLNMLVATAGYTVLSTPLLDRAEPVAAAEGLIEAARQAGAAVLLLPFMAIEGPAALALREAMARCGVAGTIDNIRHRAALDATGEAEAYLRAGLGAKKLKELRRLANRMADEGVVQFAEARAPAEIAAALDRFLALEASGWKGRRGTGLGQRAADARFIHAVAAGLGARGQFSVLELTVGDKLVAAGLVIRQGDHAIFFKIAYDETYSRFSPGVQLTVELTRRLCADPAIHFADSIAVEGHPMIDHVWRERLAIGDLYIPTGRAGSAARAIISLAIARRRLRARAKALYLALRSSREKRT